MNECVELINGHIVDVNRGSFYEKGTSIIVKDGRIKKIKSMNESFEERIDYQIDLHGKTVLPTLFNNHCHISNVVPSILGGPEIFILGNKYHDQQIERSMNECLEHGITHIRDTHCMNLTELRTLKKKINEGKVSGPRINISLTLGPVNNYTAPEFGAIKRKILEQAGFIFDYSANESGSVVFPTNASIKQVEEAVDIAVKERGAQSIKIGDDIHNLFTAKPVSNMARQEQLDTIVDRSKKYGIPTTMHHVTTASFRRGVKAGVRTLTHAPCDAVLTDQEIEAFLESGAIFEPTLSVAYGSSWDLEGWPLEGQAIQGLLNDYRAQTYGYIADEYWVPELVTTVKKGYERASAGKTKSLLLSCAVRHWKRLSPLATIGAENVTHLFEYGATIGFGNDGGFAPTTPATMELEVGMFDLLLNKPGKEPLIKGIDMLRIATINGAKTLNIEEDFGSIDEGKVADLVIIEGNPLEDILVIGKRVDALFMDGRLVINHIGLQPNRK